MTITPLVYLMKMPNYRMLSLHQSSAMPWHLCAGEDGAPGEGGGGGGEEEGPEGQDEPAEAQAGHGQASIPPFRVKGTVPRDFRLQVFSWISLPQVPEYPQRDIVNFFKNSQRYLQLNVHHQCRWHWWQMEKILRKVFNNLFGHHG